LINSPFDEEVKLKNILKNFCGRKEKLAPKYL